MVCLSTFTLSIIARMIRVLIVLNVIIKGNDFVANTRKLRKSYYKIHSLFFFHYLVGNYVLYVCYNISC